MGKRKRLVHKSSSSKALKSKLMLKGGSKVFLLASAGCETDIEVGRWIKLAGEKVFISSQIKLN